MAFGKSKDDDDLATGRYVVETVTATVGTPRKAIQEALNDGASKGWKFASMVHNDKNGQFVIVWDKG